MCFSLLLAPFVGRKLWTVDENHLLLQLDAFVLEIDCDSDENDEIFAVGGDGCAAAGDVVGAVGYGGGTGRGVAVCGIGWGSEPALWCPRTITLGECRTVGQSTRCLLCVPGG